MSLPYMQQHTHSETTSAALARPAVLVLQKKEGLPPSPPPRPGKTHHRSSSLDLAQLNRGGRPGPLPPFLPPRASPARRTSGSTEDLETVSGHYFQFSSENLSIR